MGCRISCVVARPCRHTEQLLFLLCRVFRASFFMQSVGSYVQPPAVLRTTRANQTSKIRTPFSTDFRAAPQARQWWQIVKRLIVSFLDLSGVWQTSLLDASSVSRKSRGRRYRRAPSAVQPAAAADGAAVADGVSDNSSSPGQHKGPPQQPRRRAGKDTPRGGPARTTSFVFRNAWRMSNGWRNKKRTH